MTQGVIAYLFNLVGIGLWGLALCAAGLARLTPRGEERSALLRDWSRTLALLAIGQLMIAAVVPLR